MDILRLLAIYLVIFNHTGDKGYTFFATTPNGAVSLLCMVASVFCKIAVPLFFMISGALLLPKEETLKQLFFKRILRMVIVLLVVSLPYYFWMCGANGLSVSAFFSHIYGESATTSLWYLYSYIALLLMMPFLRSMVRNMKEKDFVYLIIGYIVMTGVLPCLEYLLWKGSVTIHESFSPVMFLTQNVFFALIGYYVEHVWDHEKHIKRNMIVGLVWSVLSIAITCLISYGQMHTTELLSVAQTEAYFNCFICIPTITVYLTVKHWGSKIQGAKISKVLSILGSAVFGVYLIEKIMRALTGSVHHMLAPYLGSMVASWIWCLVVLCASLVLIVPLKHIPGLKKIVNRFI